MGNIKDYLIEAHNRYLKYAFNKYVSSITDDTVDEDHKLLNAIYDLEFFIDCAKQCAEELRDKLNQEMQDTGVISFKSERATATLAKPVPSCVITNEKELAQTRPDLFTTPEPKPNKIEIAKLLRKGEAITGAVLTNGGPLSLRIKAIQQKSLSSIQGEPVNV